MPYNYLRRGKQYGLRNRRTGRTTWYNPSKVSSMDDLKKMARLREAYAHGWKPTKQFSQVRSHTRRGNPIRSHTRRNY